MSARAQAVRWKIARRHIQPAKKTHRLRWALVITFVLVLLTTGASAATGLYLASKLPSANGFHIHYTFQDARIYDAHGDLLYDMADLSRNRGKRQVEPLQGRFDYGNACAGGNHIPRILQDATIATEDATFYKNLGFDPLSIVRAAYQNFTRGHIVSGASTITQQVVRANMLSDVRTLNRKAEEVALAYEISKKFSKRKILWYYLNSVPYGNLAYGVQAAAQVYFFEPACKLDLAQAALLAGLPRAPSLYDPVIHRTQALIRLREVLGLMYKHGYLHARWQIRAALQEARGWRFHALQPRMRYPQFVRYALSQLHQMPDLWKRVYQGIDIYTTLDPRLQDVAQSAVTKQIDGLTLQHVTDGALVSLDLRPQHYGWILAMVGSAHYRGRAGQINMAISPRQPGSSMKPFNYIWAFSHGASPGTTVTDSPIRLPDPQDVQHQGWYQPDNYDHQFHGTITLRQALDNSLNVPAVKVEFYLTGPHHVAQTAATFGMTSLYHDNPGLDCSVCYAVTLGGLANGTRLLEETSAYGVFATGGMKVPPLAIWKIVQRSTGKVLYCSEDCPRGVRPASWLAKARQRVLDQVHAYEMTNVLSDNGSRCTPQVCEFGFNSPLVLSRTAAAKTGTTNDWTDNWTVGYTPQIVTGVWTGNADRSPMVNVIGITGAAPVWHDFMESSFKILKLPVQQFVAPAGVISTNQCLLPDSNAISSGATDLYAPGSGSPRLPLCSLPDRGYMPVPCSQYPNEPNVWATICVYPGTTIPYGAQSPRAPNLTQTGPSTYGYGPTPVVPYNSVPQPPIQSVPQPPDQSVPQPPVQVAPPPAYNPPVPLQPPAPPANTSPLPAQPSAPPIINPSPP